MVFWEEGVIKKIQVHEKCHTKEFKLHSTITMEKMEKQMGGGGLFMQQGYQANPTTPSLLKK